MTRITIEELMLPAALTSSPNCLRLAIVSRCDDSEASQSCAEALLYTRLIFSGGAAHTAPRPPSAPSS